jgi:hypothetical protein
MEIRRRGPQRPPRLNGCLAAHSGKRHCGHSGELYRLHFADFCFRALFFPMATRNSPCESLCLSLMRCVYLSMWAISGDGAGPSW